MHAALDPGIHGGSPTTIALEPESPDAVGCEPPTHFPLHLRHTHCHGKQITQDPATETQNTVVSYLPPPCSSYALVQATATATHAVDLSLKG